VNKTFGATFRLIAVDLSLLIVVTMYPINSFTEMGGNFHFKPALMLLNLSLILQIFASTFGMKSTAPTTSTLTFSNLVANVFSALCGSTYMRVGTKPLLRMRSSCPCSADPSTLCNSLSTQTCSVSCKVSHTVTKNRWPSTCMTSVYSIKFFSAMTKSSSIIALEASPDLIKSARFG
jgi:hypothetical protein